jgi:hypothetical protein
MTSTVVSKDLLSILTLNRTPSAGKNCPRLGLTTRYPLFLSATVSLFSMGFGGLALLAIWAHLRAYSVVQEQKPYPKERK